MAIVVLYIDLCPLVATSTIENTVIPSYIPLSQDPLLLLAKHIWPSFTTNLYVNAVLHVFGIW